MPKGVEKQIDRTEDGPNVPADTAVHMDLESSEQAQKIAAPPGPLKITITEAILLCLENNRSLVVQRLNPAIQQTAEEQERAVFDPAINADVSAGRVKGERLARSGSETEDFTTDTAEGIISLEQYFPTGTTVALEASSQENAKPDPDLKPRITRATLLTASFLWSNISRPAQRLPWKPAAQ